MPTCETISYLKGYSYLKLVAKKLSNRKHTASSEAYLLKLRLAGELKRMRYPCQPSKRPPPKATPPLAIQFNTYQEVDNEIEKLGNSER